MAILSTVEIFIHDRLDLHSCNGVVLKVTLTPIMRQVKSYLDARKRAVYMFLWEVIGLKNIFPQKYNKVDYQYTCE